MSVYSQALECFESYLTFTTVKKYLKNPHLLVYTEKTYSRDKGLVPWQVIKKTKDILKRVIPCSLVTTTLRSSREVVGKKAGDLTSQARVNSFCGATLSNTRTHSCMNTSTNSLPRSWKQ